MTRPLSINLSAGRSCFTQCRGCYNHFGPTPELAESTAILKFLAHLRRHGIEKVTICGGDPLSRPDILTLLEGIKQLGLFIQLDTVGTPLLGPADTIFYGNSQVSAISPERLASLVDLIGLPIDGASDAAIAMFRVGRAGLYAEQLEIVRLLERAGASLCINTVIHRGNVGDVHQLVPILMAFPSIRKWQLFEYSPTGPLGWRNRSGFEISQEMFDGVMSRVCAETRMRRWTTQVEPKTNASRKQRYLLIDSNGIVWIPSGYAGGERWDPAIDGSEDRIVVGDIRREEHFDRIVHCALHPAEWLGSLTLAERQRMGGAAVSACAAAASGREIPGRSALEPK